MVKLRYLDILMLFGLASIVGCATQKPLPPVSNHIEVKTLPYEKIEKPSLLSVEDFMKIKEEERELYLVNKLQESFKKIDLLNIYIERNQDYINQQNKILLPKEEQVTRN